MDAIPLRICATYGRGCGDEMMRARRLMIFVRTRALSLVPLLAAGCTAAAPKGEDTIVLSLEELIDHPGKHAGSTIVVEGFVRASWGEGAVFSSREAETEHRTSEGVRLVPVEDDASFREADGTVAQVTGVFQNPADPWGDWPGVITVHRVVPKNRFRLVVASPREATDMSMEEIDEIFYRSVEEAERRARQSN